MIVTRTDESYVKGKNRMVLLSFDGVTRRSDADLRESFNTEVQNAARNNELPVSELYVYALPENLDVIKDYPDLDPNKLIPTNLMTDDKIIIQDSWLRDYLLTTYGGYQVPIEGQSAD